MIRARAPSNIALIKYMGKTEASQNRPTNPSLSYTLDHLWTEVVLEPAAAPADAAFDRGFDRGFDRWEPLSGPGMAAPELSEKGREKFLRHFDFLKREMKGGGSWVIRSANNFPSDCGLASSASSFAALTKAANEAFQADLPAERLSELSRQGSGSSCRSLFSPWAQWEGEGAKPVDLPWGELLHAAVIVHAGVKEVSSSEAHVRVTTSPRFQGRPERAAQRLRELTAALKEKDWAGSARIILEESNDMHELFETSEPSFRYRNKKSADVADACQHIWNFKQDGPWVTMDAGPNLHLLFRPDQRELADKMVKHFRDKHVVLTSWDRA